MVRRHPLLPAAATPREPRTRPQAFPRGPSGPWSHAYHGPGDPPPRTPDGTTSATARTQPKWAPPHSPCKHTHTGPGDARRADDGPARPGGDACCRAGGQHGALPVLGGIPGTCAVPLTTLHWPACMPAAHRRRPAFRPLDESLRGLQKRETGSGLQTNTSYGSLTLYINKGFPTLFNTPDTLCSHVPPPDRVYMYSLEIALRLAHIRKIHLYFSTHRSLSARCDLSRVSCIPPRARAATCIAPNAPRGPQLYDHM